MRGNLPDIAVKHDPKVVWPKVHLIYFMLASLDVAAILASLMIGFQLMSAFERGADRNLIFDRQAASLIAFSSAITEAQSLVVNAVVQKQVKVTASDLAVRSASFRREFSQFRAELATVVNDASLKRITLMLAKIETGFASMEKHAFQAVADIAAADEGGAAAEFSQMQSRYLTLQFLIRDVSQKLNLLRKSASESDLAGVRKVQSYEYAIAGILALIILGVITYGHYIGRLMKRKYMEVASANVQLEASRAEAIAHSVQLETINQDIAGLNREMQENLAKLAEAQDELVRKGKMAQLGQLTATVAHELRNPLGAVRTSVFLLERKTKGKGLGIEPQIERIGNGVTRCDNIISQLLDFSRTKVIQPEMIELDDWLARVIEEEAQKLPEMVAVECRLGLGNLVVPFDLARLTRVIINLLSNASEAMVGKGDDAAKITVKSPLITVSTARTRRGVELSISDNGPGISNEHMSKIFEPLFTTKNFGTGLGLPAIQKIMEQHGGGLEVYSQIGQGAAFTAWWPEVVPLKEAV